MSNKNQNEHRRHGLQARRSLTPEQREIFSSRIAHRFVHSTLFYRSKRIAIYLPAFGEVDTTEIIQRSWRAKKKIFTPVIDAVHKIEFWELTPNSTLRMNRFKILEPVDGVSIDARKLDIVLTPVVAFDTQLNRIGMGGGFYDRHFAFKKNQLNSRKPKLVGLAFSCQRVAKISRNPWDVSLCDVLSE